MGAKNIYERFVWFDDQVKGKKFPNATSLAEQFEISSKTAQRDIDFMRDRLLCPLDYDSSQKGYCYNSHLESACYLPLTVHFRPSRTLSWRYAPTRRFSLRNLHIESGSGAYR